MVDERRLQYVSQRAQPESLAPHVSLDFKAPVCLPGSPALRFDLVGKLPQRLLILQLNPLPAIQRFDPDLDLGSELLEDLLAIAKCLHRNQE